MYLRVVLPSFLLSGKRTSLAENYWKKLSGNYSVRLLSLSIFFKNKINKKVIKFIVCIVVNIFYTSFPDSLFFPEIRSLLLMSALMLKPTLLLKTTYGRDTEKHVYKIIFHQSALFTFSCFIVNKLSVSLLVELVK